MIWCLHGFLGHGSDWTDLCTRWTSAGLPRCVTPSLFSGPILAEGFEAWVSDFVEGVAQTDREPVLLGYSLGGRLALHAISQRPDLWTAAIIVSAHLGLEDEPERHARKLSDERWAERFEHDDWDGVLDAWNAQAVFGGRLPTLTRESSAFDRQALASALNAWSLGAQAPLGPHLSAFRRPVLWIAGADDARAQEQGRQAVRHLAAGALRVAPGAAHRVPWEASDWFATEVIEFIRSLDLAEGTGDDD
jgi:2-succinyl-6-hydroxy-2,4-cyclohexadiene-1-carboxylate synthase